MEFFQRLYVESERYRHPMLAPPPGEPARDVQAEHEALARAALTRDADLAVALLAEHYRRTAQRVERLTLSAEDAILGQTAQARIDLATLAP
jgi:DNA-binding GntR family transcriptional regulator